MTTSVITSKGQTTIPKEIRDYFHLKVHDRLLYISEKDRLIVKPLTGTILDLKGAFPVKRKLDFKKLKDKMVRHSVKKILKEME